MQSVLLSLVHSDKLNSNSSLNWYGSSQHFSLVQLSWITAGIPRHSVVESSSAQIPLRRLCDKVRATSSRQSRGRHKSWKSATTQITPAADFHDLCPRLCRELVARTLSQSRRNGIRAFSCVLTTNSTQLNWPSFPFQCVEFGDEMSDG